MDNDGKKFDDLGGQLLKGFGPLCLESQLEPCCIIDEQLIQSKN